MGSFLAFGLLHLHVSFIYLKNEKTGGVPVPRQSTDGWALTCLCLSKWLNGNGYGVSKGVITWTVELEPLSIGGEMKLLVLKLKTFSNLGLKPFGKHFLRVIFGKCLN